MNGSSACAKKIGKGADRTARVYDDDLLIGIALSIRGMPRDARHAGARVEIVRVQIAHAEIARACWT